MVDFNKIRSQPAGQWESFERFVALLAKEDRPADAAEFINKNGLGGDRGVDCLWRLSNGDVYAWQAKYLVKGIDSRKLIESFKQAADHYEQLRKYTFALPIDPTDGQDDVARAVRATCIGAVPNRNVDIDFWWRTDLHHRFLQTQWGHRETAYWFGEEVLLPEWWERRLNDAESDLALHRRSHTRRTRVPLSLLIAALCGDPAWREYVGGLHTDLAAIIGASSAPHGGLTQRLGEVAKFLNEWYDDPSAARLRLLIGCARASAREVASLLRELGSKEEDGELAQSFGVDDVETKWAEGAAAVLARLLELLKEPGTGVYGERAAVATAPRPRGLDWNVLAAAKERHAAGRMTVVIAGDRLGRTTNRADLLDALDLGPRGDDALALINAAGRATNESALLVIASADASGPPGIEAGRRVAASASRFEFIRVLMTAGPDCDVPPELRSVVVRPTHAVGWKRAVAVIVGAAVIVASVVLAFVALWPSSHASSGGGVKPTATASATPTGTPLEPVPLKLSSPTRLPDGRVHVSWTPQLKGFTFWVDLWAGSNPIQSTPVHGLQSVDIKAPPGDAFCIRVRGDNGQGGTAKSNVVRVGSLICNFR